jgi:hypothetical protein
MEAPCPQLHPCAKCGHAFLEVFTLACCAHDPRNSMCAACVKTLDVAGAVKCFVCGNRVFWAASAMQGLHGCARYIGFNLDARTVKTFVEHVQVPEVVANTHLMRWALHHCFD